MLNLKMEKPQMADNTQFELATISILGDRQEQQDSNGYSLYENEGIVVVCDGMGGHRGGALASKTAVESIIADYNAGYSWANIVAEMQNATQNANRKVFGLCDEYGNPLQGGSTLVSVFIRNKQLFWNSVGDSRAYLYREKKYIQFTKEHNYKSMLKEQLNSGIIDRVMYDNEMSRGEALVSYLGIQDLRLIDYNEKPLELKSGDKIVIMSDGLYKVLTDEEIFRIIDNFTDIVEAVQALELKAKRQKTKKRDNMTVAIIKVK